MELDSGKDDARTRSKRAPCVQLLISTNKRRAQTYRGGKVSKQYKAEPDSAEMLVKTIVSINGRVVS